MCVLGGRKEGRHKDIHLEKVKPLQKVKEGGTDVVPFAHKYLSLDTQLSTTQIV